jgi:putative transposase
MRRSRFCPEQIVYALRQEESGAAVADVCRQSRIHDATFYVWRKRYANLGTTELRVLCEENAKLKRQVADLTLDKRILGRPAVASSCAATQAREPAPRDPAGGEPRA